MPLPTLSSGRYKKAGGIPKTAAAVASFCLVAALAIGSAYVRHVRRVQRRQADAPPAATAPNVGQVAVPLAANPPAAVSSPANQGRPQTNAGPSHADSPDLPEWTPDANALARLGTQVTFSQHAMRLAAGFSPTSAMGQDSQRLPGGGTSRNWAWASAKLASGRHAFIYAEVREPPAGIDGPTYFDRILPDELKALRASEAVHAIDIGRLGGKRAVRVTYLTREGPTECIEIHRFEGNRQVVVTAGCPAAQRAELLHLLEAALLTVRADGEAGFASLPPPSPAAQPRSQLVHTSPVSSGADTQILGGTSDQMFREPVPEGALLIGFEVGTEPGFGSEFVKVARPIFRTAQGDEILGQAHGSNAKKVITAKAKEGYAVGGMVVKAGLCVDGLSIVFVRVKGDELDTSDSYESQWIGGMGGNAKIKLGCDGSRVVALIGKSNGKECSGIGLSMKH